MNNRDVIRINEQAAGRRTRMSVDEWVYRQLQQRAWSRRSVLGGIGSLTLIGCSGGGSDGTSTAGSSTATGGGTAATDTATGTVATQTSTSSSPLSCVLIPEETVGPFPLFNDIAAAAVYQREDITDGKTGVPLRLKLAIVDVNNACVPVTSHSFTYGTPTKTATTPGTARPAWTCAVNTFAAACR